MNYRLGSRGEPVKYIQIALEIEADGIFGRFTEAAVKNYQLKKGYHPDGVVTPDLFKDLVDDNISTDLSENIDNSSLNITRYHLSKGEYVDEVTPKEYIFLHHTAGSHNPYLTIDIWNRDPRGRVGTHYVIGGIGLNGDSKYDGKILEAIPQDNWAYHLGGVVNRIMHKNSLSIEICSYGFLTEKDGKYYTYTNREVPEDQVYILKEPFRGHKYYHKYSDKQIESVKELISYLSETHSIDVCGGLRELLDKYPTNIAFDIHTDAVAGKMYGILSHTNVRRDKTDIYPDHRIIDYINSF